MVILCILIFPFEVLAELVASTDSKKTAAATVVTMPKNLNMNKWYFLSLKLS